MSEEILINVTPQEPRVAVIENGVLQEIYIERARHLGIVGNIYKGRVARILPGMQAAFVEIGLDRAAFLHAADIRPPENGVRAPVLETVGAAAIARAPHGNTWATPRIHELLHDGQDLIVQVVKDPLGSKGARLTTQITLPARYLVFMPYNRHIGVSQKIGDDGERERLRALVRAAVGEGEEGGYILRTLAETATESELQHDIRYLRRVWAACGERILTSKSGELIHEDLTLPLRAMRDLVRENVEK